MNFRWLITVSAFIFLGAGIVQAYECPNDTPYGRSQRLYFHQRVVRDCPLLLPAARRLLNARSLLLIQDNNNDDDHDNGPIFSFPLREFPHVDLIEGYRGPEELNDSHSLNSIISLRDLRDGVSACSPDHVRASREALTRVRQCPPFVYHPIQPTALAYMLNAENGVRFRFTHQFQYPSGGDRRQCFQGQGPIACNNVHADTPFCALVLRVVPMANVIVNTGHLISFPYFGNRLWGDDRDDSYQENHPRDYDRIYPEIEYDSFVQRTLFSSGGPGVPISEEVYRSELMRTLRPDDPYETGSIDGHFLSDAYLDALLEHRVDQNGNHYVNNQNASVTFFNRLEQGDEVGDPHRYFRELLCVTPRGGPITAGMISQAFQGYGVLESTLPNEIQLTTHHRSKQPSALVAKPGASK